MGLISDFISAFFPFRCHVCAAETQFGVVLCQACHNKLENSLKKPQQVFDTVCDFPVLTLSKYDSFVADVIKLIKYRPSRKLAINLTRIISNNRLLSDFAAGEKIFIPVPMHKTRLGQRGFNQAELLAQAMAGSCGGYFSPALIRVRATIPQASCSEDERLTNLDQAIELADGLDLSCFEHKDLVIVDDVATTGTTLQQCRLSLSPLKPAGIMALVLSHSFRKKDASGKASAFDNTDKEI